MKKPIVAAVAFDSESESDDSAPSPHTFRTALSSHHGGSSANTSFEERRLSKVIDGGKPQKVPWTSEEDTSLLNAIIEVGVGSWAVVAHKIQGRTGKQCRERWHNQLNPDITKAAWTTEEELVLLQAHRELGNKWVDIAKRLNGRTDNAIKNHWNSSLKRRIVEETGQLLPEDASTVRPSQASLQRTMPAAHVDQELLAAAARAARQSLEASGDCSPPPHHQQQHSSSSSKTASVTVFSMQSSSDVKKTATQSGKKQDERRARETAPQMFAAAGMLPPTPLQLKGVPSELMPDTPPSYPSMSPSQHRQFMREEEEGHGRYERKPLAPQRSHDDDEAPFHLRKPAASDSKKRRKLNDLVVMVGDEDSVRVQPQPGCEAHPLRPTSGIFTLAFTLQQLSNNIRALTPFRSADHKLVCRSRSFSASHTCLRKLYERRGATSRGPPCAPCPAPLFTSKPLSSHANH